MLSGLLSLFQFARRLGTVVLKALNYFGAKKDAALAQSFDEANDKSTKSGDSADLERIFRDGGPLK